MTVVAGRGAIGHVSKLVARGSLHSRAKPQESHRYKKMYKKKYKKTRSRVGKSPWVFRLSLCLVDFTAMVFRHVLLAASFFGTAGNELGQQILASSTVKFAFFGKW